MEKTLYLLFSEKKGRPYPKGSLTGPATLNFLVTLLTGRLRYLSVRISGS